MMNQTHGLFTPADAERLAERLNTEENSDRWQYLVVTPPADSQSRWCYIAIHDENGDFIGRL
jgi:hypothetical protein